MLFHKVDVLGISSPASFHICYPQPDGKIIVTTLTGDNELIITTGNKVQAIPSRSIQSGSPHSSSSSARRHSDSQQSTAAQSYLGIFLCKGMHCIINNYVLKCMVYNCVISADSLLTVRQLLIACESVTDWYTLGIHLGLTTSQLDNIRVTYHVKSTLRLKCSLFG